MYDMDISGDAASVSLVFENNRVSGARKIMQKAMLWLVQENSIQAPYGTGFYGQVSGSNTTTIQYAQGSLAIALTDIRGNLQATRTADDPTIEELSGAVRVDPVEPDKLLVDIAMILEDGSIVEDTLVIPTNEAQ